MEVMFLTPMQGFLLLYIILEWQKIITFAVDNIKKQNYK